MIFLAIALAFLCFIVTLRVYVLRSRVGAYTIGHRPDYLPPVGPTLGRS